MLSSVGRAAVRRVVTGAPQSTRTTQSLWSLNRVNLHQKSTAFIALPACLQRSYATATKVATKSKTTSAPKKTAAKSAVKKSPASKSKVVAKAKKPAAKKSKPKPKPKKKKLVAKKKVVKKAKKVITPEEKARIKNIVQIKRLKEAALSLPPTKPTNAYKTYITEQIHLHNIPMGDAAAKFKTIPVSDLERLQSIAAANIAENDATLKKFLESHTPAQIKLANNARIVLAKKFKKSWTTIKDPRLPKRPKNAWVYFVINKQPTTEGDSVVSQVQALAKQWKALSPSERRPFEELAQADKERYTKDCLTSYGPSGPVVSASPAKARV